MKAAARASVLFVLVGFVVLGAACPAPPPPASEGCTAGEQIECACPGGDDVGTQVCNADGAFGACDCPEPCVARDCTEASSECGDTDDLCGGTLDCGGCAADQVCELSDAGNTCECPPDEVLLDDACDLDECASGASNCDPDAICTNTAGAFTCACDDGFVGDGIECDLDECLAGVDNCDANATCTDAQPGFACACNGGFIGDGVTCAPDPATTIADIDARPAHILLNGNDYEVRELGQIAAQTEFVRVQQGLELNTVPTGLVIPPIVARRVRGNTAERAALVTAAASAAPLFVPIRLDNIFGESVTLGLTGSDIEITDSTETVIGGGESEFGEIVITATGYEISDLTFAQAQFIPSTPSDDLIVIDGVLTADVLDADIDVSAPGPTGTIAWRNVVQWLTVTDFQLQSVEVGIARNGSITERDAAGVDVGTTAVLSAIVSEVSFFNPTKPYGTSFLIDVKLATGRVTQQ